MSKTFEKNPGIKGGGNRKTTRKLAAHKEKAPHGVIRKRSLSSGVAPTRRKLSVYTPDEADWLNALAHSAAKGAANG